MSYEFTLKQCSEVLNSFLFWFGTKFVELARLADMLGVRVLLSHFLEFWSVVICELILKHCSIVLKAYTRFELFLGWSETKSVALTHLVAIFGLEVLFFTLFEFFGRLWFTKLHLSFVGSF